MLLRIVELGVLLLVLYVVISQLIVPGIRRTKLFPLFRREHRLKESIIDLNQEQYEATLERALAAQREAFDGENK